MAAFQDITWTTGVSGGGTPNNLPTAMPATVAAGDILVCAIWNANLTPPAGWTLRDSSNNTSDRMRLYTKVAAGTEGGTTVNFTERAGTTAGLQFAAAVARYTFTAASIAVPYTVTGGGGQFGPVGSGVDDEILIGAQDIGTSHFIGCYAKFYWNLVGPINPPPTYVIDAGSEHLNDRSSRTFRHSTTAANGSQDAILYFVDTTDVTGVIDSNEGVTATGTAGVTDMTINGVSVQFSTPATAFEVPVVVVPAAGGGLLSVARHMQYINMPYEAHSAMLRRRGRRA